MLVEGTVQTGGARFVTTRLLASPVNRFFRRQWVFLLRFRFLQFRLIELLNLSHIGLVRHCCRGRGASCERVKSGLRCGRCRVPCFQFFAILSNATIIEF